MMLPEFFPSDSRRSRFVLAVLLLAAMSRQHGCTAQSTNLRQLRNDYINGAQAAADSSNLQFNALYAALPQGYFPDTKVSIVGHRLLDLVIAGTATEAAITDGDGGTDNTMNKYMERFEIKQNDEGEYMVLVDITATSFDGVRNLSTMLDSLQQEGKAEKTGVLGIVCSSYLLISEVENLADEPVVKNIQPTMKTLNTGSVTSQGDQAVLADQVREAYGVSGAGVTIGVLSDSFDCLGGYANDLSTGDLPADVNVLQDYAGADCTDEGRAMMQILHDVAPDAQLAFHTNNFGIASFATGILELAGGANCDVIVDDSTYLLEPMFQDGLIAQAVDAVTSTGVSYFSAAGNRARNAWEAPDGYVADTPGDIGSNHDFGSGNTRNYFGVPNVDKTFRLVLQWDQPSFQASDGETSCQNDVDFFLNFNDIVVDSSQDNNIDNGEPMEVIMFNPSDLNINPDEQPLLFYDFSISLYDGLAPGYMKVVAFDDLAFFPVSNVLDPSTIYGHSNARSAMAVGAAPISANNPPPIQLSSSAGGQKIFFDTMGVRLPQEEIRLQPRIVGPDGVSTTFFGPANSFFGTSAAAPHIAAVAALMLEANINLPPDKIYSALESTAIDMDDPKTLDTFDAGFDFQTGYGFVNALAAFPVATANPTPERDCSGFLFFGLIKCAIQDLLAFLMSLFFR